MRVIFAGTPAFAAPSLNALIHSTHEVIAVLTQPDRPSGRGKRLRASAVKQLAQENRITVFQPATLKDRATLAALESANADVMVVAAYGLLLPEQVLKIPRHGCLNIHASLLPRWRGAAPIQRAIESGDRETGISIMLMDAGLDTGDVITMASLAIEDTDTALSLHDKLARLGARLIVETLDKLESGQIKRQPQDEAGACYAAKLSRKESLIDWRHSAQRVVSKIHAFNPSPGAKTRYRDTELKLYRARVADMDSKKLPGTVLCCDKQIIIQADDAGVEILALQKPGGRVMTSEVFLNGFPLAVGERLY